MEITHLEELLLTARFSPLRFKDGNKFRFYFRPTYDNIVISEVFPIATI